MGRFTVRECARLGPLISECRIGRARPPRAVSDCATGGGLRTARQTSGNRYHRS
jgi:hypothetical protein